MILVGAGVFSSAVTAYLGAASKSVWTGTILSISQIALGPPICQAADYWGRKWFLVISAVCGLIGAIVVSRAHNVTIFFLGFGVMSVGYSSQALLTAVASEVLPRLYRPLTQAGLIISGCKYRS
jgi:MFS family permease